MRSSIFVLVALFSLGNAAALAALEWALPVPELLGVLESERIGACGQLSRRLASVESTYCDPPELRLSGAFSGRGTPILVRDYPPLPRRQPLGRVLLFGGIHGDELSSVSIVFRWMEILNRHHSGLFHWRVIPALNPDGLLLQPPQRMNARGVDLNRNFPSPDWHAEAPAYWERRTGKNPRRYPGPAPLSEPESRYLAEEIELFRPDVIVAVHAPLEVLDFDGPPEPPRKLGSLWLDPMGTYPGSLGRWAGLHLGLPIVTIELGSAGTMPSPAEQLAMWTDLVGWLEGRLRPASTVVATGR